MSTRQHRITSVNEIRKKLTEFQGKKINFVMNDQTVLLATVQKTDDQAVEVLNMRLKRIHIPFEKINEIYYDTKE